MKEYIKAFELAGKDDICPYVAKGHKEGTLTLDGDFSIDILKEEFKKIEFLKTAEEKERERK